jgi:hypothetical protein
MSYVDIASCPAMLVLQAVSLDQSREGLIDRVRRETLRTLVPEMEPWNHSSKPVYISSDYSFKFSKM